ncbi:MAG: TonB-dependent receptor [Halieaceae bacterium]|nr:TonB-dependent receptor [Halieaceae bacterium]
MAKKTAIFLQATALIPVLASQPALAQAEGGAFLEEVIVTAQRRSESLDRTPVTMTSMTGEQLRQNAIVSEMDLQNMAGVTIKASQNGNQLNYAIRGQTIDAFTSSRPSVLPYTNEVQIGLASSSAFYDLASIQILKGPQGTLFGRNSTGGAVLFTTEKPGDEFGGYATIWGGNYGEVKAEGAVDIPLVDDKALLRLSGFYQENDGWQENTLRNEMLGQLERKSVRASLTLQPTDTFSNETVVTYYDAGGNNVSQVAINSYNPSNDVSFVAGSVLYGPAADAVFGPGAWDAIKAANPGFDPDGLAASIIKQRNGDFHEVRSDAPSAHESENLMISNITSIELSDSLEFRSILGYNDMDVKNVGDFDGTEFTVDWLGEDLGRRNELTQLSAEFQLQGLALSDNLTYVVGLYYSDEEDKQRSQSNLVGLEPFIPFDPQVNSGVTTNETTAIYGQGTYDLSQMTGVEGLGFTLGLRYSDEDVEFKRDPDDVFLVRPPADPTVIYANPLKENFQQTSWTIGLQWQGSDETLLYASSHRGYRSGGFNFYAPPAVNYEGDEVDAGFLEEEATDFEVGVKYLGAIGDMPVRFNLAGYFMTVNDIQRANYVAIFGALAGITVNVPETEIKGLDMELVLAPTEWLTLGSSLSLSDSEFTDGTVSVLDNPNTEFGPYPDTPDWSGSLYATASFQVSDRLTLLLHGDVYGQDDNFISSTNDTLNPGSKIDSYTVANFRVALSDEEAGWTLTAHLRNAFDEEYYVGGIGFKSLFSMNTAVPAAPQTYMLEASYKF